jgi:fused signal recognition particle receptor
MFDFFGKKKEENIKPSPLEGEGIFQLEERELEKLGEGSKDNKSVFSLGFDVLKKAVAKTSETLVNNVVGSVEEEAEFSEFVLDDMEDLLIRADLGVNYASELVDKLRNQDKIKPSEVRNYLKNEFLTTLASTGDTKLSYKENDLNIYFVSGVNGVGKTTLIGKLAYRFKLEGKRVLIAAGDTFRAAAEEQLDIWSERAGADIVRRDKADPASVVSEAIQKARIENYDVILVDTAGRLKNKYNLMEELSKIKAVIDKNGSDSLRECILVLDANTGQNGLQQAKVFQEAVNLTSVALTKLDGSAKGAIVLAIAKELKLPVKLIGVGEKMEDLKDFDSTTFINALFA